MRKEDKKAMRKRNRQRAIEASKKAEANAKAKNEHYAKMQMEKERRYEEVGVKIDRTQMVFIPGRPYGKTFFINGKSAIYVQDVCEMQNSSLFEEGLKLIDTKVSPARRSYLAKMFGIVLPKADMTLDDMLARSCDNNLGLIIALVCDIALHNNKKLAHPQAYDKDFNKYVANLFHEYCLDGAYSQYIHLAQEITPVPEFLTKPEKYNFVAKTA